MIDTRVRDVITAGEASVPAALLRVVPRGYEPRTPTRPAATVHRLQIIFKTVERCNLACPYCYYFNGGDQSYKERPARTSLEVLERLCEFLEEGVRDLHIDTVDIVFHGGEPMLQRMSDFEECCRRLRERIGPLCNLTFAIQTNGTKLDSKWADVLERYGVFLGVSLDGPAEIHDPGRPFHNGKGSLSRIVQGLEEIRLTHADFYGRNVGVLTVLNAKNDYSQIARFFHQDLGIDIQSFLLPDCSYDDGIPEGRTAEEYGKALCDIFDWWLTQPHTSVREVDKVLKRFQRATLRAGTQMPAPAPAGDDSGRWIDNHVIVLQSDGSMKVDDSYIPASDWREAAPVAHIRDVSLKTYLEHEAFQELFDGLSTAPTACQGCSWVGICGGGDLENRWSRDRRFDNPSIFCESLKMFYAHIVGYLVSNGYPQEYVDQRLSGTYDFIEHGYAS